MKTKFLDILGVSAAFLCLIHCIVFPLLMIVPLGMSHNAYIDLFFLMIGAVLVYRITRKPINRWIKLLFWVSVSLIALSVALDLFFHLHSEIILIGAVGLIVAHLLNFKYHRH